MPIARSSVLWAHVLTSLVSNGLTLVIIVGVALVMGFRTSASLGAWLAVAGILALFTLALTWIAVIAGLSEVGGRCRRILLPADLPAVHQLGVRPHRDHAGPGARASPRTSRSPRSSTRSRTCSPNSRSATTSGSRSHGASASSSSPTSSPWLPTPPRPPRPPPPPPRHVEGCGHDAHGRAVPGPRDTPRRPPRAPRSRPRRRGRTRRLPLAGRTTTSSDSAVNDSMRRGSSRRPRSTALVRRPNASDAAARARDPACRIRTSSTPPSSRRRCRGAGWPGSLAPTPTKRVHTRARRPFTTTVTGSDRRSTRVAAMAAAIHLPQRSSSCSRTATKSG